jgi:hypothetical protein
LTIPADRLSLVNDGQAFGFQVSGGKKKDKKPKKVSSASRFSLAQVELLLGRPTTRSPEFF